MSKYVLVNTISQFRMRYVVEVPDDVEEEMYFKDGTRTFPCTPIEYASDSVVCEDVREFSQEHLGETIFDAKEISLQEAIDQYRIDNDYLSSWSDEQIIKSGITEIGFSRVEYEKEEEKKWRLNTN